MEHWIMSRLIRNLNEINMDILQIQWIKLGEGWKAQNLISSFTRVYMIISGEGYLKTEDKHITMRPGHVYVIPAGVSLSYGCVGHLEKLYFHVSLPLNNNLDLFIGVNDIFEFEDKENIDLLMSCGEGDTALRVMRAKAYLYGLISKCLEKSREIELRKYSDYVTEIISYVEDNLSANLTVDKIADSLFTSPAKLRKKFLEETGMTIGKYIDERVMFIAELEVRAREKSLKEISDSLGFCDQFYFSRCYTKKYGISPMKYRKAGNYRNMD